MILKPTELYPDSITLPATEPIKVTWKNNGDMMVAFEFIIEDNSTGDVVFNSGKIQSYSCTYTIPANTLVNGNEYRYRIRVYNKVNASVLSDYKIIRTNSRPKVTILSDGYVRNQVCAVQAEYSHDEDIPIKAYRFVLYDEYEHVIEQSKYFYDDNLSYTFDTILKDDTRYSVECFVISQNDIVGTSGKVSFIADYIPPSVHFNLNTECFIDKPYVRLSWTTVRIIGKTDKEPVYINESEIDLRCNRVYFDEGFNLENNFTVRIWVKNMPTDKVFLRLVGENGEIYLTYYNNKVHAFKDVAGYVSHVATDTDLPNFSQDDEVYICLEQINKNLNIKSEVLS